MPVSICSWNSDLAHFFAVSLCLQARVVLGNPGTQLVAPDISGNSLLSSKAQACLVGQLQTLARVAINSARHRAVMLSESKHLWLFRYAELVEN